MQMKPILSYTYSMGESGAEEREIQSGKSRANKNTAGQQNQTHKGMSRRTFMKVVGTGDQRSGAITTGQLQTD